MSQTQIGISILRFGLATVFIWFGVSQLFNPTEWIGWVPVWAMELPGLSDMTILKINAFVEIVGGALLAFGIYTRVVAAVLAAHVALITYEVGYNAIGIRDLGLTAATLSLVFLSSNKD